VGRCLTDAGYEVLWASEGRGPDTAARAREAGLTDAGTVPQLVAKASVILSICPPQFALDVARQVRGFSGLYLDSNAISPVTAGEVAQLITEGGGRYVDGGIIGSPPEKPGSTRLYLSGTHAGQIPEMFAGTPLEARVLAGPATAASALKMAYASWTKGTAALLLTARAFAQAEGVEDALLSEWAISQPRLAGQSARSARDGVTKGWRWVSEMEEIARSMAGAGLPDGFHLAAAEIFRRCPRIPGSSSEAAMPAVMAALTGVPHQQQ
jgi:3-hydroxyisobutyrate dehydrogenase-like beta-hydroxyacid dehydrogenase